MINVLIRASKMLNKCPMVHGGIDHIPFDWLVQVRRLIDDFESSGIATEIPKGWSLVRDNIKRFDAIDRYRPEDYATVDPADMYTPLVRNTGVSDHNLRTFSSKAENLVTEYEKGWKLLYKTKPHCTLPGDYDKERFITFNCRSATKDEILRSLKEHAITVIHGPGGIGKTTMLSEIAETAEKKGLFTRVVYAKVPKYLGDSTKSAKSAESATQVQTEIAQQLGVPSTELKQQIAALGNVLVILDDVWNSFETWTIGIPSVGVKVLIGTRWSSISFGAANKIRLNILDKGDSLQLLEQAAPNAKDSAVAAIAEQVRKECCGLPLALAAIGKALAGKEKADWECAANYLKDSNPSCPQLKGVEHNLYKIIMYSYEHLDNVMNRRMFLCCCLFQESEEVHALDLKRYLAQDEECLAVEAYEISETRVQESAEVLEQYGLLQNNIREKGTVRMHDVVRDVGVYIARDKKYAIIHCDAKKKLSANRLTECKRVSLSDIKIAGVLPDCPQLETLLIRGNTVLPDLFLKKMVTGLSMLDLSYSDISTLPSFPDKLQVRTLLLNGCQYLRTVDEIVQLTMLGELSLRKSVVQLLPKDLVLPTVLDWEDSSPAGEHPDVTAEHVPRQLKELSMDSKYLTDDAYQKITGFENLEAVKLYVTKSALSTDIFADAKTRKWENFTIYNHGLCPLVSEGKHLSIMDLEEVPPGVKALLKITEEAVIEHCFNKATMPEEKPVKDAKSVLVLTVATGQGTFEKTKILRLKQCPNISYLTSKDGASLTELVEMELTSLKELLGISKPLDSAEVETGTFFGKVQKIAVKGCDEMKCVVPNELLQKVHNTLEVISVRNSRKVEYIFHLEANSSALFSALRSIEIDDLEMLKDIWQGSLAQGTFQNLKEFTVRKCNKLTRLFTIHVAKQLKNLQKLTVEGNSGLKEIVSADVTEAALTKELFPRVTHVSLQDLPILKHFSSNQVDLAWPGLVKLKLGACPNLTSLSIGRESAPLMKIIDLASENDSTWFNPLVTQANNLERFEKWVNNVKPPL